MTQPLEFIVLSTTRFGESRLVVHTLSRELGRKGLIVSVGKKAPTSLFLPLNILEGEVTENPKSDLWTVKGLSAVAPLNGIRSDIRKNTITLFLSEVLFRALREGTVEEGLYDWAVRSIFTLDGLESDWSNFPIRFLLEFSTALGFSPSFDDIAPFAGDNITSIEKFLHAPFEDSMLIPLSGEKRSEISSSLLRYIEFHTELPLKVRSLDVLHEIYKV